MKNMKTMKTYLGQPRTTFMFLMFFMVMGFWRESF